MEYPPPRPAIILFKPDGGSHISNAFVDQQSTHPIIMPNGQILITPYTVTFSVDSKHSISRAQYAFTDIKSQGQTILDRLTYGHHQLGRCQIFCLRRAITQSRKGEHTLINQFRREASQASLFTSRVSAMVLVVSGCSRRPVSSLISKHYPDVDNPMIIASSSLPQPIPIDIDSDMKNN
jgi:hypothetical protein